MKKNLAILFGISSDYSFALANVLTGLRRHSPRLADDIVVLHEELPVEEQARLNAIQPCRFKIYEPPVQLPDHHLTKFSFSRYEGFGMLRDYRHVLWLDVDLLICGDVSDILEYAESGMACCFEPRPLSLLFPDRPDDLEEINRCDFTRSYFNTGVMLLSDALERPEKIREWLYSLVSKYPEFCMKSADQGTMNLMAQVFGVPVRALPERFNCMICNDWHPAYQMKADAKIVHSITEDKFWNYWCFRDWERQYRQWVDAGGRPADGYLAPWRRPWLRHAAQKMRYWKKQTSAYRHMRQRAGKGASQ